MSWQDFPCVPHDGFIDPKLGYGRIHRTNGMEMAHRVVYERAHGPIPGGLEIDHLCNNRACVEVKHMEVVTHKENCRRRAERQHVTKTHCPNGHEYDEANTYIDFRGHRRCRRCLADYAAKYRERQRS